MHRGRSKVLIVIGAIMVVAAACGSSSETDGPGTSSTVPTVERGLAGPSAGCTADGDAPTSATSVAFQSGGEDRTYNLTVPTDATVSQPMPLVVNLHGSSGTEDGQDQVTAFPELAQQDDFVVLTPQALEPDRLWRLRADSPDPQFIKELIDQTTSQLCIDQGRVYLTGFSLGGMLSMALACQHPERYAAIGVVAGLNDASCPRTMPVPMIAFQGTDDPTVRFDGTYPTDVQTLLGTGGKPRLDIAEQWSELNACATDAPSESTDGPVTVITFSCPADGDVRFYRIEGGTHHWPGGQPVGYITGVTTPGDASVNATQLIWDFFAGFQR